MRFCGHVPNLPKIKNLKFYNPYLLKKWFSSKSGFLHLQNKAIQLKHSEKVILSTLNIMILQMVKSEDLRFGEHVDFQVRYKILWLEVPKRLSTLRNLACFEEELF